MTTLTHIKENLTWKEKHVDRVQLYESIIPEANSNQLSSIIFLMVCVRFSLFLFNQDHLIKAYGQMV